MADLDPNDAFQDRGLIKVTDGSQIMELDSKGNIVESNLSNVLDSKGSQKFITTRDVNELFSEILVQLKIIVAQNNEVHDLTITELDIKEK